MPKIFLAMKFQISKADYFVPPTDLPNIINYCSENIRRKFDEQINGESEEFSARGKLFVSQQTVDR